MERKNYALIPAYQPDEKLIQLCRRLTEESYTVIVVDDGSGPAYAPIFQAAESYARRKVVQPRGCLSLGILAAIRRLSPAAAGVLCRVSDRLLDRIHSNIPNPADRRQIGVDRTGGRTFLDQKIGIILYVRLAVIKVPAFIIFSAPKSEFDGMVLILPFAFFRDCERFRLISIFAFWGLL